MGHQKLRGRTSDSSTSVHLQNTSPCILAYVHYKTT